MPIYEGDDRKLDPDRGLETMRAFATEHVVRVDIVLTVAITAMARKVILVEPDHVSSLTMLGVAALIGALAVAYHAFVGGRTGLGH